MEHLPLTRRQMAELQAAQQQARESAAQGWGRLGCCRHSAPPGLHVHPSQPPVWPPPHLQAAAMPSITGVVDLSDGPLKITVSRTLGQAQNANGNACATSDTVYVRMMSRTRDHRCGIYYFTDCTPVAMQTKDLGRWRWAEQARARAMLQQMQQELPCWRCGPGPMLPAAVLPSPA